MVIARARTGARVRRLGGVRLRIVQRALDERARMGAVVLGTLGGCTLGGVFGAVAGMAGAIAWPRIRRLRAARAGARLLDEQVPDLMRSLAAAIRAGRSIPQALEAARDEAIEPMRAHLERALARLRVGMSIDSVLDAFARETGSAAARGAAQTIAVGRLAGGNFPRILDEAVSAASERSRIARDRLAGTANARMSALVVAAMPAGFYVLVGSDARANLLAMLRSPVGWAIVLIGLGLQGAGAAWMRAMTR